MDLPRLVGAPPGGAAELGRVVVPRAAADHVRIVLRRSVPGVRWERADEPLITRLVLVEAPFGHVAVHVVEAPGIRFLAPHFLIFEITVLLVPGVVAELGRIVAERGSGGRARPAGVLPFG